MQGLDETLLAEVVQLENVKPKGEERRLVIVVVLIRAVFRISTDPPIRVSLVVRRVVPHAQRWVPRDLQGATLGRRSAKEREKGRFKVSPLFVLEKGSSRRERTSGTSGSHLLETRRPTGGGTTASSWAVTAVGKRMKRRASTAKSDDLAKGIRRLPLGRPILGTRSRGRRWRSALNRRAGISASIFVTV